MPPDSNTMHPEQLDQILHQCWALLKRGVEDRRFGFHHPVLSNVTQDGKPGSRVVILRAADAITRQLRFHTDIRSPKWQDLVLNPSVSVSCYDEAEKVQLRLAGQAKLHHADDVSRAAWEQSQRMSRITYGSAPGPGAAIAGFDAFDLPETDDEIAGGFSQFGAIVVDVISIDWLYLKARRNRRAHFDLVSAEATWLVP